LFSFSTLLPCSRRSLYSKRERERERWKRQSPDSIGFVFFVGVVQGRKPVTKKLLWNLERNW